MLAGIPHKYIQISLPFPKAFAYQNVVNQKEKNKKIHTKEEPNGENIDTIWSERQPKIDYFIYFLTRISCAAKILIYFDVLGACVKNGP